MVDLHVHTKYSLLDSIIEPEDLINKIKDHGKKAICITEHGNLYSSIEIYKLCKKHNIKYLHGCEFYICSDVNERDKDNKYNHLILISKNEIGRLNLIKLVSESNKYKYYGKPRIDYNMLLQHKEGIVVLSACMAGEVQRALSEGNLNSAKNIVKKYKKDFKDDYYLEFQSHSVKEQQELNRKIVDLAKEMDVKYVVTTDAHYLNPEDKKYHDIFVQIGQSREAGETYSDCYVQSVDDVLKICTSTTKEENLTAIKNTEEIGDKCNVEIPLSPPILPHVEIPKKFKCEIDYLKHLCVNGWKDKNLHLLSNEKKDEYKSRLHYEITTIEKMGFEGYFLLVWSYANSVKRRGIARGSGGGSLVAYLINIVDTDPVKYGLYFERFIDVGALKLLDEGKITKSQLKIPDFDLDFGKEDRNKVVQNIIDEYGENYVASLGSFQYMWAKGAIKDIGKVLNIPFEITNNMTSNLGDSTIQEVLELGLLKDYEFDYPELFDYAKRLAGLPKSFSMHPCGKCMCMKPVQYYNATDISEDGELILQGDMHTAEDLGIVKMDILGLRTVDVIYDTLDLIGKDYAYIAPHNIDFDDKKVLSEFRRGNTDGIFQFESQGMKGTLQSIECNSLYDLTVANALYRPGSMPYITDYAQRRKGLEEYSFLHDDLKDILQDSYSIIIFQEQLIEIGRMAGLSNPDELRQATAKKKAELMDKIRPELFEGLKKRGWEDWQIDEIWETMLRFAKYSFNKSHSVAYAIIAYICMYLKTHHPKEFMVAWINSVRGKIEKLPICLREASRIGVKIYFPKWGSCTGETALYRDGISLGTGSVKNCNAIIAEELMELSKNKYNNFIDLLADIKTKTSVNSRQIRILILLNFFSEFGKNKYLLDTVDIYDKFYSVKQINKNKLESLGIPEELIKKYSKKETQALYKEIDNDGLIKELTTSLVNKPLSVIEQIKGELEYLEYTTYVNPNVSDKFYAVIDFKTFKNKAKPYVTLRNIKTGEEMKTKIKQEKIFIEAPFKLYNILKVDEFKEQFKTRNIGGVWRKTDEKEKILHKYSVVG